MSTTQLCRDAMRDHLGKPLRDPNVGLLLRRGMIDFEGTPAEGGGGQAKSALLRRIGDVRPSLLYTNAYQRWKQTLSDTARFASFEAKLTGRLYIGVNRDSALETGLTVHHSYGMPMIPGSALKGLARACATSWLAGNPDALAHLFGTDPEDNQAEDQAGGVVFHDAWWIPDENLKPFVPEILTPHHPVYYSSHGETAATDFDNPIPAPQLAVQGRFLFVIEGDAGWTKLTTKILKHGLAQRGIGGKTSSGYGFFEA